jgi:hypothetical protein
MPMLAIVAIDECRVMRILAHIVEARPGVVYAGYAQETRETGRRFDSRDAARGWIEHEAAALSAVVEWEADASGTPSTAN